MDTTTVKGFQLLERLAQSDAPRGVSELARETELTKSNVQRILATLTSLGYVGKERQTNRYFATLKTWEVGNRVLQRDRILRTAASAMKILRTETGETTVLCILDDTDVVYIDKHESENPIRLSCAVGTRLPAYSTATGRVIAAFRSTAERRALIDLYDAQPDDGAYDLDTRFKEIRGKGVDISEGGYRAGVNSIAAPIHGADGTVVASIAITGPEERLPPQRLADLTPKLMDAATRVSGALGFIGGTA